jgi:hypothetical protein
VFIVPPLPVGAAIGWLLIEVYPSFATFRSACCGRRSKMAKNEKRQNGSSRTPRLAPNLLASH